MPSKNVSGSGKSEKDPGPLPAGTYLMPDYFGYSSKSVAARIKRMASALFSNPVVLFSRA